MHKTELRSQTLLYQTLHARWNKNDIQDFLKTVGFHQKYSDIKTPAPGFDFETCSAQPSVLPPPPTIQISVGGIYLCDITNTWKQLCSPDEPFVVVLEKGFFKNEISPFGVDFEICNFVDRFMPKHTLYTLTKIQKVKKHNRTPLTKYLAEAPLQSQVFFVWCDKLFSSAFANYLPFFSSPLHLSGSVRLDGGRRTFSGFSRNIWLGSIPGCGWATQGHSQSCL